MPESIRVRIAPPVAAAFRGAEGPREAAAERDQGASRAREAVWVPPAVEARVASEMEKGAGAPTWAWEDEVKAPEEAPPDEVETAALAELPRWPALVRAG